MTKKDEENLHAGHYKRLKQSFISAPLSLHKHQLIEVLLVISGKQRRDLNPAAHRLINAYGSVRGVLNANEKEMTKIKGVSPRMAHFIKKFSKSLHCLETHEFYYPIILNSREAYLEKYRDTILELNEKQTLVSFFDKSYELNLTVPLAPKYYHDRAGSLSSLLTRTAEGLFSNLVVLARFWPDDEYKPTNKDIMEIKKLYIALRNHSVLLEEYIVVTPNGLYSYKEHNVMRILSALLYGDNNYIRQVLDKPKNQLVIAEAASKVRGPDLTVMDKTIIACCNFNFTVMIHDIFD